MNTTQNKWAKNKKIDNSWSILMALLLVTFDTFSQIDWHKCLGGTGEEIGFAIRQTSEGGYVVAGTAVSTDGDVGLNYGTNDGWVVKLTATGNITWKKIIGGSYKDYAHDIKQTSDGGYIVTGITLSNNVDFLVLNHGMNDAWAVKLSSTGAIQWKKCYGGSSVDYFSKVEQTADGGFLFAGSTLSNDGDLTNYNGNGDVWAVKTNSAGVIQWQKRIGGSSGEQLEFLYQDTNGSFLLGGFTSSWDGDFNSQFSYGANDAWLAKLSPTGSLSGVKVYGGSNSDFFKNCIKSADGNYLISGGTLSTDYDLSGQSNAGMSDMWLLKIDTSGVIKWQKTYGGSGDDFTIFAEETPNGYFLLSRCESSVAAGATNNGTVNFLYMNLDSARNIINSDCFGGSLAEMPEHAIKTTDGGFAAVGRAYSNDIDIVGQHGPVGEIDALVIKFSAIVGLNETNYASNSLKVYPIPANTRLNIEPKNDFPLYQNTTTEIYNTLGQKVSPNNLLFSGNKAEIDVANLDNGVYFLILQNPGNIKTSVKFIVAR